MITDVKAIIFDMDGVLIYTEPLYFEVAEKLFKEEFNLSISEGYMDTVGSKDIEVLAFLIERFGLKVDIEKLMQRLMQRYIKLLREKASPMPGIEVIDELKKHYRLALASSSTKECVKLVLKKFRIVDSFEVILTGDDIEHGKPDPEIYLLTAKKLGLNPCECLAIEDSENGVNAAKNAGMKCVAIPTPFNSGQNFSRANIRIDKMIDLYKVLNRL
jgi:HAD superfamily hydrolase (TIGR01509 family)